MNELWSCHLHLKECPHCKEQININLVSYKSLKDVLDKFYKRMEFHKKNQCDYNKIKILTSASIQYTMVNNKMFIEKINILI
jgi:hypothetical protein